MARRTKEQALETRQRILVAALDLFCSKGYSQTTFVDIARRIDMTKGAVYWHFPDKPSLLVALIIDMRKHEDALISQHVPEVKCLEDMKAYFVAHTRVVMEDDLCRKFAFFIALQMEWSPEMLGAVRDHLVKLQEWPFDYVEQFLVRARDAGELRSDVNIDMSKDILVGMWRGLIMCHLAGCGSADPAETIEYAFDTFIASIRAH
jgi:TetR/AcrR family acrAB operon transcriptional repressor